MSIFCRHEWQTNYNMSYTYGTLLPVFYECAKCGQRKGVSRATLDKIVAGLKAKETEEINRRMAEQRRERDRK